MIMWKMSLCEKSGFGVGDTTPAFLAFSLIESINIFGYGYKAWKYMLSFDRARVVVSISKEVVVYSHKQHAR